MDATLKMAAVNGTHLHYDVAGQGDPVVLIHGLALDKRMWDDQVVSFAERYRVIRYDLRGFGNSALPTAAAYSHAEDLRALLDYLDAPQAHVIGLSMGGSIALQHALLYPGATLSVVLVDSALDGHAWSDSFIASFDAIERVAQKMGAQAGNAMWLDHELFAPAREKSILRAKLAQIVTDYSGWAWLNQSSARRIDPPSIERLNEVCVPTLVIIGERDLPDFKQIAETLAAGIPNAQYVMMMGAGHMSNMEQPEEFNAIVMRFLSSLPLR